MGFAGSGHFDTKQGILDYAVQDLLRVRDDQVAKTVTRQTSVFESAFSSVSNILSPWATQSTAFYGKSLTSQSTVLKELANLNGTITNALVPVRSIETGVSTIARAATSLSTSVAGIDRSLSNLSNAAKENNRLLEQMRSTGNSGVQSVSPQSVDYTQGFSDVIDRFTESVESLRSRVQSVGDSDLSEAVQEDLTNIQDQLNDLVNASNSSDLVVPVVSDLKSELTSQGTGIISTLSATGSNVVRELGYLENYITQVDRDLNTAKEELGNGINSVVTNAVNSVVGSLGDVENVISTVGSTVSDVYNNIITPQNPNPPANLNNQDLTTIGDDVHALLENRVENQETLTQFHTDVIPLMESIDEHLVKGLDKVRTSVGSAGQRITTSGNNNSQDIIDQFDDDGGLIDRVSTGTGFLGNLLSGILNYAGEIVGIFSWKYISDHMEKIHTDARSIMQMMGKSNEEATALRQAVFDSAYDRFGGATFGEEEIENALSESIRAGISNADQLQVASNSLLNFTNTLPGISLDFTKGWTKYLIANRKDAEEYIAQVGVVADDLSNNFYVTADLLTDAVASYSAAVNVFAKGSKDFSAGAATYMRTVTAQEEAAIQSMDVNEFLDRISWTSLDQLTDADYARMANQFGISGQDLLSFRSAMRNPTDTENYDKWFTRAFTAYGQSAGRARTNMTGSDMGLQETTLALNTSSLGMSSDEFKKWMQDNWGGLVEARTKTEDFTTETSDAVSELAKRTKEAANNNWAENVSNIAEYMVNKDGFLSKIFNKLENWGVPGGLVGAIGGAITGGLTTLGVKGLINKLGGGTGGGLLGGLSGLLRGGSGSGGGGLLSRLRGFLGGGGAGGGGGLLSRLGSALSGLGGKLTSFFGNSTVQGLAIAKGVWDIGAGANNATAWTGDDDYTSSIASAAGGSFGGGEGGLGNALGNAGKWAAIGTAIAPGVGTAVGGILGGIAGLIGGDKIAKGIDDTFNFIGDTNDKVDLWMEDKLGGVGRVLSGIKNSPFDAVKDIGGGVVKGVGNVVGGIKDGVGKVFSGDFLGGLKSVGGGLLDGIKSVGSGIWDAATDIWDNFTMSAEDRIKKRKGDVTKLNDEVNKEQAKLDKATDDLTKSAAQAASESGIVHTGESIFKSNADKARTGSASAAGLNSYSYTDYAAEAFVENNNKPITHTPAGTGKTAADFGITSEFGIGAPTVVAGGTASPIQEFNTQGPILNGINSAGPENVSTPIVNALNTNMDSVIALLQQIVNNTNGNKKNVPATATVRQPGYNGNKDNMNSTAVLNYQGLA